MPRLLLLRTPTSRETVVARAAASDRETQRWLNWDHRNVTPWLLRQLLINGGSRPGRPAQFLPGTHGLIAVDPPGTRIAGSVTIDLETGEIGGSLAPRFRGQGLGADLFGGAAEPPAPPFRVRGRTGRRDLAQLPRERRANHLVDVARGYSQWGRREQALTALLDAEQLAPAEVRCRPMARTTITDLVHRERGTTPSLLSDLAARAGVPA